MLSLKAAMCLLNAIAFDSFRDMKSQHAGTGASAEKPGAYEMCKWNELNTLGECTKRLLTAGVTIDATNQPRRQNFPLIYTRIVNHRS